MGYRKALLILVLGCFLAGGPAGAVTPYDDVLMSRALKHLQQENFEEALEDLTQAWQQGTRTPEKAYYLGVVYRRMMNYPKAREYLEEAVRLKPDYLEARRLLADTLLTLEQVGPALPHLKELEKAGFQPAQTAYLLGVAAFKQKKYQQALDYFTKAQEDPALAQEAKVQMSQVLAAQNRLKDAQKRLQEAIALAPQTDTAGFAQRYSSSLERRLQETRPFRAYASFSFDWDSNVTLNPGGAAQVSGQGDSVYTYTAAMEYNLFPQGPFGLVGQYAVAQNFHRRLTKYDTLSHIVGVVPMYQFQNSRFWLPFNFNYTDVENDKYYTGYVLTPTYLYLVTPNLGLETAMRLSKNYYWFPINFSQDNRTARNIGGSLGMYYFFKNQQGYLQARFSYEHSRAVGDNWSNSNYRIMFLALYPVTSSLKLTAFVDLGLQPYEHPFFDGAVFQTKRRDKVLIAGATATYTIYRGLEFNVHYYAIRDDSNTALYDYMRHIVGCQIGYRY
jgi:tetratricopeptide (TPR) repeat protein